MIDKIKDILRSLGLLSPIQTKCSNSYSYSDYKNVKDERISEVHLSFLYKLEDDENSRLTLLENKTSQLISQTGIVFSLLSLFVPLLVDKVSNMQIYIKVILLLFLLLSFGCYMLTIGNALKNFKLTNFPYSKPSARNVIKLQRNSITEFNHELIQDILYGLQINKDLNNLKATNLIHSYNAFRMANAFTAMLLISFCAALLFLRQQESSAIRINGQIKFENMPDTIQKIPQIRECTIYLEEASIVID